MELTIECCKQLSDEHLSRLLQRIPRPVFIQAIADVDEELRQRFYGVVSESAIRMIQEDLSNLSDTSATESAREQVVLVLKNMLAEAYKQR